MTREAKPQPRVWLWITFTNGMSHACPAELEEAVMASMLTADPPGIHKETTRTDRVVIDQPGMVAMNRPWEEFRLDDLRIEIPCEDVASFALALDAAKAVESLGTTFYRMPGFHWRCIVLTADARERLLAMMSAALPDAEAKAQAFYADRQTPQEALRALNESEGAVGVPYQPDKNARHRPRERGEA